MPGGDRTGPLGFGSMTGRGAGYCAGYNTAGFANPVSGRGGFGRGAGRGFGRGLGRGFGFRRGFSAPVDVEPGFSSAQEKEFLKEEARRLKDDLEAVNLRIKELEPKSENE